MTDVDDMMTVPEQQSDRLQNMCNNIFYINLNILYFDQIIYITILSYMCYYLQNLTLL